ncbi:MAG: hypothetical protein ACP5LE_06650, partial [Thermoplasmata archaeon]
PVSVPGIVGYNMRKCIVYTTYVYPDDIFVMVTGLESLRGALPPSLGCGLVRELRSDTEWNFYFLQFVRSDYLCTRCSATFPLLLRSPTHKIFIHP